MTNFKTLLFLLISIIPIGMLAQLSFEEIGITGQDDIIFNPRLFDQENLDLDQDGDFDILVHSNSTIVWYENRDGTDNFSSAKMIYNSDSFFISDIEIGDLDGDGDIDIVCVRNNSIIWLTNQGNGNFTNVSIINENFNISAFTFKINDIDGDNDNDILFHLSQGVVWYENIDGIGTFANPVIIIPSNGSFSSGTFILEDVNADSKIDVILFDPALDQISWYENFGNMTFSTALPFHENLTSPPFVLKKVDIDGDANADFVAERGNTIVWYEFDGIGALSQTNISIEEGTNAYSLIATDFDADGDQDLLYTDSDSLFWLENNDGMGTFSTPNMIDSGFCIQCSNRRGKLATGDFDGNGTIDVIASIFSERLGTIYKYSNLDGQGTFDTRKIISEHYFTNAIKSVDIDNDGDLDVLSKSFYNTSIYRNLDGNGYFGREEAFSGPDGLKDLEPIDIDNDGDLDIVAIRDSPNPNLVWYENVDGAGLFKNSQVINSTIEINIQTTISDIAVGDIDKDGYQDFVLVQHKRDQTVYWLRNENGSGTFSLNEVGINIDRPYSVQLGDIDGDRDLDVVLFEDLTGLVKWFENIDGKGNFAAEVIVPNGLASRGLCLADLDQDNDLDVITFGRDIKWHENTDGAGNFSDPIVIGNPSEFIQFVEVADLDGDFDKDVVWKSWGKKGVFWYENLTGNEDFSDEIPVFISDRTSVDPVTALGDFNGDSKIDIAHSDKFNYTVFSSTFTPDRLIVLLNEGELGNQIIGKVTNDYDSSGCDDVTNPIIENLMITSSDGTNSYSTFTLPNGLYSLNVGEGTYTTTVSGTLPAYYGASPSQHEFTFDGTGTTEQLGDFCIEAQQVVNDLEVQLFPLLEVRPGFETRYLLTYKNVGTTVLEGGVNLNFNESVLNFIEATEAPSAMLSGVLTFDIGTLLPFESNAIQVNFLAEPPPTVNIDDLLVTSANGTIITQDDFLENNEFILNQVIIGSYDPNDITVLEGNQILLENANDYLHYIIRFQNTGTAAAINVKVKNILDSNLDWTTFQLVNLSHSGRVEITDGSQVKFIFNDINLPDSTNDEPNSHGYIAYKIKPKNNIAGGDIVLNTAGIFFDFNPPIITNTVHTEITDILSISDSEFERDNFSIFPIPSKNKIFIINEGNLVINEIEIFSIKGVKLISQKQDYESIDISNLSEGIYFLRIKNSSGYSTKKIVKK